METFCVVTVILHEFYISGSEGDVNIISFHVHTQKPFIKCNETLYKLSHVCLPHQYSLGLYSPSDKT